MSLNRLNSTTMPANITELMIFDPPLLTSNSVIKFAIREMEASIDSFGVDSIIDHLVAQPICLAFVIAVSSEASPIISRIRRDFPSTPNSFVGSVAARVLSALSPFMLSDIFSFTDDTSRTLNEYQRMVEFASSFSREPSGSAVIVSDHRYHIERLDRQGGDLVNPWPFFRSGSDVHRRSEVSTNREANILRGQKQILEFYISTLRTPDASGRLRNAYVPSPTEPQSNIQPVESVTSPESTLVANLVEYPILQSVEDLYFDKPKGMGEWKILIQNNAVGDMRAIRRRDAKGMKIVLRKLVDLSKGHFSADNHRQLNNRNVDVPIYRAKLSGEDRLIYQIDCVHDYAKKCDKQIIRVFGIYTLAKMDHRLWDALSHQLGKRGKEYIDRCKFRDKSHKPKENIILPATFPSQLEDTIPDSEFSELLSHEDLNEIHSLVGFGKYVSVSQPLLYSIFADIDIQHVFQMSPREKEIIDHQSSCYVLGRSGTGKTTTMLFKIFAIEKTWGDQFQDLPKPRQLFVTKSSSLAYKVEEYFSQLMESLKAASMSPEQLQSLSAARRRDGGDVLVNRDDQDRWENRLPSRFSLLEDKHFPLFLSFDRLCELLLGDTDSSRNSETHAEETGNPASILPHRTDTLFRNGGNFISFEAFKRSYWPHLPRVKKLDPFLVFGELLGVIRGSEAAWKSQSGCLTREEYEQQRSRSTPSLLKEIVYTIFESYIWQKRERGDFDAADRVYALLNSRVFGSKVDFLYVDEAQDNLLVDALLLRTLCRNPDGLFWAGDTAQTISAGSSFSFNELKSFMYRFERARQNHPDFWAVGRSSTEPRMFQLSVNYRSHGGIVNCAHSVVEIISTLWPNAIDVLTPEKGIVDGVKPVFYTGYDGDEEQSAIDNFLFGTTERPVEFGAQQCILVRNQAAVDKLQRRGIKGSIMTLYDSKGLEFNDVLLYNFFRDSDADASQWRVILNALPCSQKGSMPLPQFDEVRHATVCNELKFLYVAVTRARVNLWIVDFSEATEPIRIFWSTKHLVQDSGPGMVGPHLAVRSSKDEWETQGNIYFEREQYARAKDCFLQASLPEKVAVAKAYHLREEARSMTSGSSRRRSAFIDAAKAFYECARSETAARRQYLCTAAECYEIARDHRRAADIYLEAESFDLAARRYCEQEMFDKAVQIIDRHHLTMSQIVVEDVKHKARLFYFLKNDISKALGLFSLPEEGVKFTIDNNLTEPRIHLFCHMERFVDASELCYSQGRVVDAVEHLLKEAGSRDSARACAVKYIVESLWRLVSPSSAARLAKANLQANKLLELAGQIELIFWSLHNRDELSMFRMVVSQDTADLLNLAQRFRYEDRLAEMVCFDHFFRDQRQTGVEIKKGFQNAFSIFFTYAGIVQTMASEPLPCNNTSIQKLFTFQNDRNGTCFVPMLSYLHSQLKHTPAVVRSDEKGKLVLTSDLSKIIKDELKGQLRLGVSGMMKGLGSLITEGVQWSLSAALIFLRHIVQHQYPTEAKVLCDYIDCICGFLAFSTRNRWVSLPLDWHKKMSTTSAGFWPMDSRLAPLIITLITTLVERLLRRDADNLHLGYGDWDTFFCRIFKALCIFGFNLPPRDKLRLEILRAITLHREELRFRHLPESRRYFEASGWHGLIRALNSSERMVGIPGDQMRPRNVITIQRREVGSTSRSVFNQPRGTGERTPHAKLVPSSVQTAVVPVSTGTGSNPDRTADEAWAGEIGGNEIEHGLVHVEDNEPGLAGTETIDFESSEDTWAQQFSAGPTQQQLHAAAIIWRAYRRKLARKRPSFTPVPAMKRTKVFGKYLAEARNMDWSGASYYRKLFLGPLPHLFLCIEDVWDYLVSAKKRIRIGMAVATGDKQEELKQKQNELSNRMRFIAHCQKCLCPQAEIHRRRDIVALKYYVEQVTSFIRTLGDDGLIWHLDMQIAWKGIVMPARHAVPEYLRRSTRV